MNGWDKSQFQSSGDYLHYGPERKFIARFKHTKGPVTKAQFMKQMIKAFTPEDYFAELNKGVAPLMILINNDPAWFDKVKTAWLNKHLVTC